MGLNKKLKVSQEILNNSTRFSYSSTSLDEEQGDGEEKDGQGPKGLKKKVKDPPTSSLIPQQVPYLLIGGGTAAFSALRAIKSTDPRAKVID